jgi:hypothetical protein
LFFFGGHAIRSIALAPSDENYIYAASYSKIYVSKDAGDTWVYIKPGLANYNMTDITVATNNADRAWVTFSDYNNTHKVYETNDAGISWTNISGNNLPELPVNCIVYQGGANDDLYIGTDVGVYYKNNTMIEWIPFNDGLPNVIVKELEIHYTEGTISAATFGRGVWESPLNTLPSATTNDIEKLDYIIYPNPAKDQITIRANTSSINISIFSLTGQKIIEATSKTINLDNLAKGCYIIEIASNDMIKRDKLVIK